MNKEELSKLIGAELICAPQCKFYRECDGGHLDENISCINGINNLTNLLESRGLKTLLKMRNEFLIRVFDSSSEIRPLPVIGDIEIKQGNLSVKS